MSGTTSGTSQLNCTNNSVLCICQFKTFEAKIANLHCLTKTQVVNVDNQTLWDVCINCFNLKFLHRKAQFTTGFNTLGVTFQLNRNLDYYRFLIIYFEQIDIKDLILYWVELDFLKNCSLFSSVNIQINCENFRSVDQFTNILCLYSKACNDDTLVVAKVYYTLAFFQCACIWKVNSLTTNQTNWDKTCVTQQF